MGQQGYIIAGPTGSGKSQLALDLAAHLHKIKQTSPLIINGDSMQVYEDLKILSARPETTAGMPPHALYGTLKADESASVGWWQQEIKQLLGSPENTNKTPIVVGGTGLYLNVLLEGISPIPETPPKVRQQATKEHHKLGPEAFFEKIKEFDPLSARKLDLNNTQRVIRAWEVYEHTGKALSYWQSQPKIKILPNWDWKIILIEPDREILYPHLNQRFEDMVHNGGLEEVQKLKKMDLPENTSILNAIGVREILCYLDGQTTLEKSIEKGQQATRNYAKRQLTWFRHQLKGIDLTLSCIYDKTPSQVDDLKILAQ